MRSILIKRFVWVLAALAGPAVALISGCGEEPGAKPIPAPATPPPANDPGPPTAGTTGLPPKTAPK